MTGIMKPAARLLTLLCLLLAAAATPAYSQTTEEKAAKLADEGIKLHDQQKYKEAIAKYDAALKLTPDDASVLYEKSYSYYEMGDKPAALKILEKILAQEKKMPEAAYILLGSIQDENKEPGKSVKTYQQGLKFYPNSNMLYFNLGITQFNTGLLDLAEASYEQALRIKPLHPGSSYAMGQLMLAKKRPVMALLCLMHVVLIDPGGQRIKGLYGPTFAQLDKKTQGSVSRSQGENNINTVNLYYDPSGTQLEQTFMLMQTITLAVKKDVDKVMKDSLGITMDSLERQSDQEFDQYPEYKLVKELARLCDTEDKKAKPSIWTAYFQPMFTQLEEKNLSHILAVQVLANNPNDKAVAAKAAAYLEKHEAEFGMLVETVKAYLVRYFENQKAGTK